MATAKYEIIIKFDKACQNCAIGIKKVKYYMSGNKTDTFTFDKKQIIIEASRCTVYQDGTILVNERNSLTEQIIKSLFVYYALSDRFPKITSISITHKRKYLGDINYSDGLNILQPIIPYSSVAPKAYQLTSNNIGELLINNKKGNALCIATSYWLKALSSNNIYFKFDRLWRALDRLMLFHSNTTKESVAISNMKLLLRNNETIFVYSKVKTNTFTPSILRKFRWYKFLLAKPSKLFSNLTEFSDIRIINLYKGMVGAGSISQKLSGNIKQIHQHFNANLTTTNDIELVLLMALNYTYHIRCRMFHGEIPDSTFKVAKNNEDWEVEQLVGLLEALVYELLENNNIL